MAGKKKIRRVNSAEGGFPVGEMIEVESMQLNRDGSIDVVILDENLPAALGGTANPKRKAKAKSKAKRKPAKKKGRR